MGILGKLFGSGDSKDNVKDYQPNIAEWEFVFQAEDVFTIAQRGTGVTGKVLSGEIHVGDTIVINGQTESEVTSIEKPGELSNVAKTGETCCIYLSDISKHDVKKGDYLTSIRKVQINSGEPKTSNDLFCRNCGNKINGTVCETCSNNSNLSNTFKNILDDKNAKEDIGDNVLAYLLNLNKITKQDFENLTIEFGYLFLDHNNHYSSLLKVILPENAFGPSQVFYIGIQNERIMLLENGFNEEMFKKTSQDMLVIHKVDVNSSNKNENSFTDKSGMFHDFGFKLIVIESLLNKDTSFKDELGKMKEKYIDSYEWNYTYKCIPEMLDFFENLRLTNEDLSMVDELSFDGGNEIYGLLMPEWDGESSEFDVNSVDDMKLLPNLKQVTYISMCDESLMNKFVEKGIEVI